MLKFSGYSYLIRGQSSDMAHCWPATGGDFQNERKFTAFKAPQDRSLLFGHAPGGSEAHHQATLEECNDARTGMPPGMPRGAMCVQRFDDSLNSAIHITYRISLRSSSMPEPRDPLLKVLNLIYQDSDVTNSTGYRVGLAGIVRLTRQNSRGVSATTG
jgi:hypothetical protein